VVGPARKKEVVGYLVKSYPVSLDKSCRIVQLSRSLWYYQSKKDDSPVMDKLNELANELPTRGFDVYYGRIRQQGLPWNRKRVLRVYRLMGLSLRRKRKKRTLSRVKSALSAPTELNQTWSIDFMTDSLRDGRRVRVFNVLDDCNRESLAIECGISFPAERVIGVLGQLEEEVGLPNQIRVDNGPEFISKVFQSWCKKKNIDVLFIQPGKPMQNAYIERFNRFFREDILDAYWFEDLETLKDLAENWRNDYNQNHPHDSLGGKAPVQFRSRKALELAPKPSGKKDFVNLFPV